MANKYWYNGKQEYNGKQVFQRNTSINSNFSALFGKKTQFLNFLVRQFVQFNKRPFFILMSKKTIKNINKTGELNKLQFKVCEIFWQQSYLIIAQYLLLLFENPMNETSIWQRVKEIVKKRCDWVFVRWRIRTWRGINPFFAIRWLDAHLLRIEKKFSLAMVEKNETLTFTFRCF